MGPGTKAFCLSGLSSLEKPFLFEINTKLVFFNFPNPTHPNYMFYKRTSDYTFLQGENILIPSNHVELTQLKKKERKKQDLISHITLYHSPFLCFSLHHSSKDSSVVSLDNCSWPNFFWMCINHCEFF